MTNELPEALEKLAYDTELAQDREIIRRSRFEMALGRLAVEQSRKAIRRSKDLLERLLRSR